MARSGLRGRFAALMITSLVLCCTAGSAIQLDKEGEFKLGVRTYVNARVGTENTHDGPPNISENAVLAVGTFPHSNAGHLRQNRAFIEAELNHDISRLIKEDIGPFGLLKDLPFRIKHLAYHVTFRGEGEGLYDWGPREYSSAKEFQKVSAANPPIIFVGNDQGRLCESNGRIVQCIGQEFVDVDGRRHALRRLASHRERLFQAYVEGDVGDLFWRVGRQILSWGETDGFQLLDHINPLDSSFGGFLIPLDERRVPLDMAIGNYYIGGFGPVTEMYLEGFLAIDKSVGYAPGTPAGSPWGLPGGNAPSNASTTYTHSPSRTFSDARGGFQLKFNAYDATFSLAHYYTYFDTPGVQIFIHDLNSRANPPLNGLLTAYDEGGICPTAADSNTPDPNNRHCGTPVHAFATAPKVQVSGASTTFAVPRFYSVVRSEIAYFKGEPAFTQGTLDPFLLNNFCKTRGDGKPCDSFRPTPDPNHPGQNLPWNTTAGRRLRDSFNAVIGIDANQWIRILNPNQTFLMSTQFFYKHILNAGPSGPIWQTGEGRTGLPNPDREVLPVQALGAYSPKLFGSELKGLGPIFVSQPADQYLQTFFIGTSYRSGTVSPGMTIFYDWGGAFLYQPSLTVSRDPFRFVINYSVVDAHTYKGGSGVSLLKDRDNVEFRLEYVL